MISMSEMVKYVDVASIYRLLDAYATALNDGDLDRWMALWINEGVLMAPDSPPRVGKEQIWEAIQPLFDGFITSSMVIHTEKVQILGDQSYAYGTYTFERIPKEGGVRMSYSGKFLDILAKQADCSWKFAIDCHNFNEPYG